MQEMKYIMVTHWEDHWDKLSNNETYYTIKMLKNLNVNKILENRSKKIPTIFIKIRKDTKEFEKAWEGYTYDFRISEDGNKIYFRVQISYEFDPPEKIRKLPEGWYADSNQWCESELVFNRMVALYPPIFYSFARTTDWREFEDMIYCLLKLLGIHDIIKFERQRGHPDGFFKIRNLAVIYDATLEYDFEKSKSQQIENFCSILKRGEIRYGRTSFRFFELKKQVWIITKNVSRIIRKINDIIVKEVSVHDLIELYEERLRQNLMEDELEARLMNIG